MKTKNSNIHNRIQVVFYTIKLSFLGEMTFDEVVKQTKFSRNEVASHISILTKQGKVGSVDGKGQVFFQPPTLNKKRKSSDLVHAFDVGCIDEYSRSAYQYLNPYTG